MSWLLTGSLMAKWIHILNWFWWIQICILDFIKRSFWCPKIRYFWSLQPVLCFCSAYEKRIVSEFGHLKQKLVKMLQKPIIKLKLSSKLSFPVILRLISQKKILKNKQKHLTKNVKEIFCWRWPTPGPIEGAR